MFQEKFFEYIESKYKSQLPFVAYRNPNDTMVKAMIQKDSKLYAVDDFTEAGFVFAPFDAELKTVLFPLKSCETISSQVSFSTENINLAIDSISTLNANDNHIRLVQKGIDHINSSGLQKVVLSRVERVPISEDDPVTIFKSLLKSYLKAFVYIWYHPKIGLWMGATPETLVEVEGLRFQTMSLAGTQPYVDSKDIVWNHKNIEEQQLVTNFIETELKPFTERLKVAATQTVRAGQLLHLKSKISGVLKAQSLKQVIHRLHPTPAVCGLPKSSAKDFILNNENYEREFYTGFLGELNIKVSQSRNFNRRNVENNAYTTIKTTSHLFVNLRCMQIKGQNALVYVGGGVTKDSNAKDEWEETVNKAQTMLRVLKQQ